MNKRLFVDDLRFPTTNHAYMTTEQKKFFNVEGTQGWDTVRSYEGFVNYIETYGLPTHLSLDHDLEYKCVVSNPLLVNNNEIIINQQCRFDKEAKNGLDCAKWLVEYCTKRNIDLPNYQCHSQNHYGKRDILELLDNYKKQIYR